MKFFQDKPGCLIAAVLLIFIVISLIVTYLIATSDLPFWLKFALLK